MKWYQGMCDGENSPDFADGARKTRPACMAEYPRLFGSCRIPQPERDSFQKLENREESRHIVVIRGARFFEVSVLDNAGECLRDVCSVR